mgnify:CR=1 FL=1
MSAFLIASSSCSRFYIFAFSCCFSSFANFSILIRSSGAFSILLDFQILRFSKLLDRAYSLKSFKLFSLKLLKNEKTNKHNFFLFLLSEWAMIVRPYAKALGQVMMTASVLMLVSLTWERHFAICYPHQYRIRIRTIPLWRHLARYIVPVVVLSFVLNIPTFINTYKVCTSNQSWYLISEIPTKTVHHSVRDNSTREHNVGKAALSQVIS